MPEIGNKIPKADIDLIDGTFNISQSKSYHLSIQIETDRLSFCVFNTVIHKFVILRSYPLPVICPSLATVHSSLIDACRPIFENDDLIRLSYQSSRLLWISPRYTLVPEQLFDPDEADSYLSFNQGVATDEHTLHRYIRPANSYQVFSCPAELINLACMYQPDISFFHHSVPFIQSVVTGVPPSYKADVAIYFHFRWLDVAVIKNEKLLFYNSFKINAPADSLYYLAGVSNLFDIDLLSTKLMYAGSLNKTPPEIEILKGYVGSITECEPPNRVAYSHHITEPFRRNFINLFNLYGCE